MTQPLAVGLHRQVVPIRRIGALALGVTLALGLVACSGSSSAAPTGTTAGSGGADGSAAGAVTVVKMTDQLKFDPASITVKVGTTVRWQNASSIQHTTTDDASKAPAPDDAALPSGAQSWDSGLLAQGATFDHVFTVAGDYTYFCIPHGAAGMVGHITVTP